MPHTALLLLATGQDRPGIVERLSGFLYEAGGNIEDSRMAALGGEFAFFVLVTGEASALERVLANLGAIARELGLEVQAKPARAGRGSAQPAVQYRLRAVSMDHPGIVHKVTRELARRGVNVLNLETTLNEAPESGTPMFALEIDASVPADIPIRELRAALNALAEAENIDLEFRART